MNKAKKSFLKFKKNTYLFIGHLLKNAHQNNQKQVLTKYLILSFLENLKVYSRLSSPIDTQSF